MGFLYLFLVGLYLGLPFGPIGILCMGNTIEKGRKIGFVSAMGAVTVDVFYGLIALFFLSPVQNFINNNIVALRVIVGLFLVFIGLTKIFGKINIIGMSFNNSDENSREKQKNEPNFKMMSNESGDTASEITVKIEASSGKKQISSSETSLKKEFLKIFFISFANIFNFVGIFTILAIVRTYIPSDERFLFLKLILGIFSAGALFWFITTTILNEVRKTITEKNIKLLIRLCGLGILSLGLTSIVNGIYLFLKNSSM